MKSAPPWPYIVFPTVKLLSPVKVSPEALPTIFSKFEIVSVPILVPVDTKVLRFTVTAEVEFE